MTVSASMAGMMVQPESHAAKAKTALARIEQQVRNIERDRRDQSFKPAYSAIPASLARALDDLGIRTPPPPPPPTAVVWLPTKPGEQPPF